MSSLPGDPKTGTVPGTPERMVGTEQGAGVRRRYPHLAPSAAIRKLASDQLWHLSSAVPHFPYSLV